MAKTSVEIELAVEASRVVETISDAEKLGRLFHTVERTEGSPENAVWYLKAPYRTTLGAASLQVFLKVQSADRCEWSAEATYLHWRGRFAIESVQGDETKIVFDLEIEDSGPLATVHNALIAVQIKNVAKLFEKNLRRALEGNDG